MPDKKGSPMVHQTRVVDFLPEFMEHLRASLEMDELRWGDTWLHRTKAGQEERIMQGIRNYYDQWRYGSMSMPWLKIIGNCFIAWLRETRPGLSPHWGVPVPRGVRPRNPEADTVVTEKGDEEIDATLYPTD